jgi:chorismate mutase/prephenate dehydratase
MTPTNESALLGDHAAVVAAYQGIESSYSSVALQAYFTARGVALRGLGVRTFRDVATAVLGGRAAVGLLPVDNAISGTIRDSYDLLAQYELWPVVELQWRMRHHLLGRPGATLSDIREVHAHPLVLAECGRFLATLSGARVVPAEDTGEAAYLVAESADPSLAAIAPLEAADLHGLVSLAQTIADHPENTTRFILFCVHPCPNAVRSLEAEPGGLRKTSLLLSTRHERGALAQALGVLADAGINLAKLESRPKLGKGWEVLFYLDLEGDASTPHIAEALQRLEKYTTSLQVIGSYGVASSPAVPPVAPASACASVRAESEAEAQTFENAAARNYPKAARSARPQGTRVPIGYGTIVGADDFAVIAGPCSIESRDQILATCQAVVDRGARALRGGAFKPRTNPYSFQGLGWEGVALLAEAGRAVGVPVVSEVMSVDQVERLARAVDVLQIGARNMQNFDLLRAVGKTSRPVLLKRGLSASLDELLAAAEYVLAEGNPHVILCERGIRTFETATRNTLDLSAVPVLKERTHLPVVVDPSHGVGVRRWIRPLCRAAKSVGADGLMLEVHPDPPRSKSDADQALTFDDFAAIMQDLSRIPWPA